MNFSPHLLHRERQQRLWVCTIVKRKGATEDAICRKNLKKITSLLVLVEEEEGTGSNTWHAATAQAVFSTARSLL
jgi:hypothetical protein